MTGSERRSILLPTTAALALLSTGMFIPTVIGVLAVQLQQDLGFGDAGLGLAFAVFWTATSVLAIRGGGLADRWGWRPVAMLGVLITGLAGGVIVALVHSLAGLIWGLVLAAGAYTLCSPTSNLVVVDAVPPERRATALGIKQTGPPLMSLLAGLAVPGVALAVGWRWVFLIAVLPMSVVLITVLRSRQRVVRTDAQGAGPEKPALRRTSLLLLSIANGFGTFTLYALSGFSVLTLVDAGIAVGTAGLLVAMASGLALAIRVFGGWWLDRDVTRSVRATLVLLAVGSVGLALMATGATVPVAVGMVIALCGAWSWPPLVLMRVVIGWSDQPGRASSRLQIGAGVGSAVGPLTMGVLAELVGYSWAWLMVLAATAAAGVVLVTDGRRGS